MKSFCYQIKDKVGIHARPAGLFVKEAGTFQSDIKVIKAGKEVDGKRIFSLMGLAVKAGEEITVTAEGPDEDVAIAALEAFVTENM